MKVKVEDIKPKFVRLERGVILNLDKIEVINEEARCLFVIGSEESYRGLTDTDLAKIKEHINIV